MGDFRQSLDDTEEMIRTAFAGLKSRIFTALPVSVSEDTKDGHTGSSQITIKEATADETYGSIDYKAFPPLTDMPIMHPGGGDMVHTYPTKAQDEKLAIFMSRATDAWEQSGGTENIPMFARYNELSDGVLIHGLRSDPNKLHKVAPDSTQIRSKDKLYFHDHHPTQGSRIRANDPSTQAASENFDPDTDATKYYQSSNHPTSGHEHSAVDGTTKHSVSVTHSDGPKMMAANEAHVFSAHPDNGTSIKTSKGHVLDAPNASLDMQGNFMAKENVDAGQNLNAAQGITAAFGAIGGMIMGGGGGGAMSGSFSATGNVAAGATVAGQLLQTTDAFVFAALPVPTMVLRGARAYIIDAPSATPTYMSVAAGGGSNTVPVFCTGIQWVFA